MPSFRSQLPTKSQYYRASDFDAGSITVTIAAVASETIGTEGGAESKLTLRFREPGSKRLVLNLSRAEAVADIAGTEDTDKWVGTRIRISKGTTRYQGQRVACMDVKAAKDDVDEAMPTLASEAF